MSTNDYIDPFGPVNPRATHFPELNELLVDFVNQARDILGRHFVGAYLHGSFAIGDADEFSDCDFLIVSDRALTKDDEAGLRKLHDEIPTRDGYWCGHLEGSYADLPALLDLDAIGTPWLYIPNGSREAQWSPHSNSASGRWSLWTCGVTLVGPPPGDVVAEVPAEMIRETSRRQIPVLLDEVGSWMPHVFDAAWTQRYVVSAYCRLLYQTRYGRICSKRAALLWAIDTLDPEWRPLLTQVLEDRGRGLDIMDRPRPGSVDRAFRFCAYIQELAVGDAGEPDFAFESDDPDRLGRQEDE